MIASALQMDHSPFQKHIQLWFEKATEGKNHTFPFYIRKRQIKMEAWKKI